MLSEDQIKILIETCKPSTREVAEKVVFLNVKDDDEDWIRAQWKDEIDETEELIVDIIESRLKAIA